MRKFALIIGLMLLAPLASGAPTVEVRVYKWVDKDGIVHYGDSIPARFAELPKEVLNHHGVKVADLAGKKTEEQLLDVKRATGAHSSCHAGLC